MSSKSTNSKLKLGPTNPGISIKPGFVQRFKSAFSMKSSAKPDTSYKKTQKVVAKTKKIAVRNINDDDDGIDDYTRSNNIITHLESICTDSAECLILGQNRKMIVELFDNFKDFRHVTEVTKVGDYSKNGFVLNLQYEKMDYKINALLKSSKNKSSDNLYYEYLVGTKFINRVNKYFPCFIETYRLLRHRSDTLKRKLDDSHINLKDMLSLTDLNICDEKSIKNTFECINNSCKNGENFAILLQYINEPISLGEFVKSQ